MFQILEFLQEYFLQQNLNVLYVFTQLISSIDIIFFYVSIAMTGWNFKWCSCQGSNGALVKDHNPLGRIRPFF